MSTVASKERNLRRSVSGKNGPNFRTVWVSLKEVAASQKETERLMKENAEEQEKWNEEQKKWNEEHKKRLKENDRIVRQNGKQLGEIHRRFGQLAEHLVAPGIRKRFNELGYNFDLLATKGAKLYDERGKIKAEIDVLLENDHTRVLVEVKSRPVIQDVEHHIKRLELFSEKWRQIKDQKKILGAIAGAIFEDDVKKAVREAGLFVIEQSGDTMKIDMPDDFIPREW